MSTPVPGTNSIITTGGVAVQAAPSGLTGGYITNPVSPVDQGLGSGAAPEPLYIDPTGNPATLQGNGTCIALAPGESFPIIPGSTETVSANAASNGHKFTVVVY